jgi:alpha-beta hydrolase superfamily lysophospholipase
VVENTADDAVPQPHARAVFDAATSADKRFVTIEGATHYYAGQPDKLEQVTQISTDWIREHGFG